MNVALARTVDMELKYLKSMRDPKVSPIRKILMPQTARTRKLLSSFSALIQLMSEGSGALNMVMVLPLNV